jgi:apolipoprotein N-acyltransferase
MAFLLNFVGMIVFVAGLGWLATSLGMAQVYVLPAALVLLALGVAMAIARTRAL